MANGMYAEILKNGARSMGVSLDDRQIEMFGLYKKKIQRWNRKLNLTAVDDDQGIVTAHFLDSLAGLSAGIPAGARVVDIGAGAGLPGLAVKIARPDIELFLIEATRKKANFLVGVIGELGLRAFVIAKRAEEVARDARYRENFDIALVRAVGELPVVAEYGFPLLVAGGRLIAYKSRPGSAEIEAGARAAEVLGGSIEEIKIAVIPFLRAERCLVIFRKERRTSDLYPRRAGIPTKRPLGSMTGKGKP